MGLCCLAATSWLVVTWITKSTVRSYKSKTFCVWSELARRNWRAGSNALVQVFSSLFVASLFSHKLNSISDEQLRTKASFRSNLTPPRSRPQPGSPPWRHPSDSLSACDVTTSCGEEALLSPFWRHVRERVNRTMQNLDQQGFRQLQPCNKNRQN